MTDRTTISCIYSDHVLNNQIRISPTYIEELRLKSYQFIHLILSLNDDNKCINKLPFIYEVVPDATISQKHKIAKIPWFLYTNFKRSLTGFSIEPIPIFDRTQIQSSTTPIVILKLYVPFGYNTPTISFNLNSIKRYLLYKPIIKNSNIIIELVGVEYIFNIVDIMNCISGSLIYFQNGYEVEIVDEKIYSIAESAVLVELKDEISQLNEFIDLKFNRKNNSFNTLSFLSSKAILISGVEGTPKEALINYLCNRYNHKYLNLDDINIIDSSNTNNSANGILYIFENLDRIGTQKDNENNPTKKKYITKLVQFIDKLKSNEILVTSCRSQNRVDQSLIRAGRIDRFVPLSIPTQAKRILILQALLKDSPLRFNDGIRDFNDFVYQLSKITPGFVYNDLSKLLRNTALQVVARSTDSSSEIQLSFEDFKQSLAYIKPGNLGQFDVGLARVSWESIGGYQWVKDKFKELIEWPIRYQETFDRLNLKSSSGVLLYGPSGCGKTMIVQAVASEMSINFISVKGSDIFSKWLGESEQTIREIFAKARQSQPCILFFDELDALGQSRGASSDGSSIENRILSQLLNEMDGIEKKSHIFLMGCVTGDNVDQIDKALLRLGRFETSLYIPLPNELDRLDILQRVCKSEMTIDPSFSDSQWLEIAQKTNLYSGAQLKHLCNQSGVYQLELDINSPYITFSSIMHTLNSQRIKYGE
ncbi:hypothetical protein DLAC_11550 [Tieghemostelium lacteum]|uniref:AAA+ ATPase domain-containing protein n=1 Tax=Tieghemostelium lacteum TaxID=361077 RepID=A0A152A282_TIELA|nr:hypothetical protein DLAC_11550 [Tieghemostelium lacteum]|eukprot:KYR00205.1 hypothetical protein DLAC_11550 [Tieghemostelium lacteum]